MRELNLKIVSHTVGEPEKSVSAGTKLLAIVPVVLKMEATEGTFTQKSFWVAVSMDEGKTWMFIDGSYMNDESLKMLIPEASGKITLPAVGAPVFERKPAG
jgi:hypothetical protein